MPSNLSEYFRGIVRVPLGCLRSAELPNALQALGSCTIVPDVPSFLTNPTQPIFAMVSQTTLGDITDSIPLSTLVTTHIQPTSSLPSINVKIHCLLSENHIRQAIEQLGQDFQCVARLYCIPSGCNDGLCYRMVSQSLEAGDFERAVFWRQQLQTRGSKMFHLDMILSRKPVAAAMDAMVPFTGLWDDLQLGNFAKYFAAHINPCIENYWAHMYVQWSKIFEGVDSSPDLLDPSTVRQLQGLVPSWSENDRDTIREGMKNSLFSHIVSRPCRDKLLQNILNLETAIPTISTFQENFRFIIIGAKILKISIDIPPVKKKSQTNGIPSNLSQNLKQHWVQTQYTELEEGKFQALKYPPSHHLSFVSLFLLVLRHFPFLSEERPYQDKKGVPMKVTSDQHRLGWFFRAAKMVGYNNAKISKGINQYQASDAPLLSHRSAIHALWRGKKPTISQFSVLRDYFFLYKLAKIKLRRTDIPPQHFLQRDFVWAFFNSQSDRESRLDMDTEHAQEASNIRTTSDIEVAADEDMSDTIVNDSSGDAMEIIQENTVSENITNQVNVNSSDPNTGTSSSKIQRPTKKRVGILQKAMQRGQFKNNKQAKRYAMAGTNPNNSSQNTGPTQLNYTSASALDVGRTAGRVSIDGLPSSINNMERMQTEPEFHTPSSMGQEANVLPSSTIAVTNNPSITNQGSISQTIPEIPSINNIERIQMGPEISQGAGNVIQTPNKPESVETSAGPNIEPPKSKAGEANSTVNKQRKKDALKRDITKHKPPKKNAAVREFNSNHNKQTNSGEDSGLHVLDNMNDAQQSSEPKASYQQSRSAVDSSQQSHHINTQPQADSQLIPFGGRQQLPNAGTQNPQDPTVHHQPNLSNSNTESAQQLSSIESLQQGGPGVHTSQRRLDDGGGVTIINHIPHLVAHPNISQHNKNLLSAFKSQETQGRWYKNQLNGSENSGPRKRDAILMTKYGLEIYNREADDQPGSLKRQKGENGEVYQGGAKKNETENTVTQQREEGLVTLEQGSPDELLRNIGQSVVEGLEITPTVGNERRGIIPDPNLNIEEDL